MIFSYIRGLGPFFLCVCVCVCGGGGLKVLYFNIFGVFRKMNIFWGMIKIWIFFGGNHKTGLFLGSFIYILGPFLKVKVQN